MTEKLQSTERSEPVPTCPACRQPLHSHNWTELLWCLRWYQLSYPRTGRIVDIS